MNQVSSLTGRTFNPNIDVENTVLTQARFLPQYYALKQQQEQQAAAATAQEQAVLAQDAASATQAADAGNVCNRNITVQKSQCKDHFTSKETAL